MISHHTSVCRDWDIEMAEATVHNSRGGLARPADASGRLRARHPSYRAAAAISADAEHVRSLWRTMADPTQATVVVAGDLAGTGIEDRLAATLGAWRDPPHAGQSDVAAIRPGTQGGTLHPVDVSEASQTLIVGGVAACVGPEDRAATDVAVRCFGGFMASRLSSRLHDGLAASYGAGANVEHLTEVAA